MTGTISIIFFSLSIGKPYIGVDLSLGSDGWVVKVVYSSSPASKSGIMEGDKPVVINNQPANIFLEEYSESGVVFGMLIKEITVSDDFGHLKSVTIQDASLSMQMVITQTTWLVLCIVFWIVDFGSIFEL